MSSEKFENWGNERIDKLMIFDGIIKVSLLVLGVLSFAITVEIVNTVPQLLYGTLISVSLIMMPLLFMGESIPKFLMRIFNK